MTKRAQKYRRQICKIAKFKKAKRVHVLKTASNELIRAVGDISKKILKAPRLVKQRKKLHKNRLNLLGKLASGSVGVGKKRAILSGQQGGGIFSILLPALLGTILPAILKK